MAKLKPGTIEEGKSPVRTGSTLNHIRDRGVFVRGTALMSWDVTADNLTSSGNLQVYVQDDDGAYYIHSIAAADLGGAGYAAGDVELTANQVLVIRPDINQASSDTLTKTAGALSALALGEWGVASAAEAMALASYDHIVVFQRSGDDLICPLNKQVWQSGTEFYLGQTWVPNGTIGQVLTAGGAGAGPSFTSATVPAAIFGDGSDGNHTVVGTETLIKDTHYEDLTIPTGTAIDTDGFRLFVHGTLTLEGTAIITNNGNGGANQFPSDTGAAAGGAKGGAGATLGFGQLGGKGGDVGVAGTKGTNGFGISGAGGKGGVSNSGTLGGSAGSITASGGYPLNLVQSISMVGQSSTGDILALSGGAGGGGGGGNVATGAGDGGAGGGGGGGVIVIAANIVDTTSTPWTGSIQAIGGLGGGTSSGVSGGAGGGGGGGTVVVIYASGDAITTGDINVAGGAGGGATGSGSDGDPGDPGAKYVIRITA